ncbi:MFS transporter [Granulicella sibirica]|uniref:Putative transporter n=1 Tax=Granulicella sibirica TaxID=2479048 RepID=A0A4Q0T034_9BACT|nr:MFS transporter [Granulicella sibirica]RXH54716.1 putative transporter [Granulicella sibirica]
MPSDAPGEENGTPTAPVTARETEAIEDKRHYIGPIKLGVGILPRHVGAMSYIALASVVTTNFLSLMQPHILSQRIHLPKELLGRTGGELALTMNMAVLIFTLFFGAIADRVRANRFMALAYVGMATACLLYPMASSLKALMAVIFLLGVSQTITLTVGGAHGLQYPDNSSRGKYGSMMSILNIGGVVLIAAQIGPRLPEWLQHLGISSLSSLRFSFWIFGLFVAPGCLVAWYWLKQDPPVHRESKLDLKAEVVTLGANLVNVLRYAKSNKRFQLVLITSLFMRSDFAVVSTFLSFWVAAAGREHGISTTDAVRHAGQMYSVVLGSLFVAQFTVGLLADRFNRVTLLLAALLFVALSYLSPLLIHDVFAPSAYLCAVLLGLAEGFIVMTLSALMGQEAPSHLRGASIGIINLIAIIGVSLMNYTGGILFDKVSHVAPFAMMAALNLGTLLWALPFLKHRNDTVEGDLI